MFSGAASAQFFCGQMCSFLLGFCSRCVKTKNRNGTNLPTVAGQSAVMMKSVPTCSTGDLTTVTLTHGGQMSLPARKRNALGQEGGDDGRDSSREKKDVLGKTSTSTRFCCCSKLGFFSCRLTFRTLNLHF